MAYCTLADLIKACPETTLIQLTNDETGAEEVDADVVAEAIDLAGGEIDSYVGVRHTVPLSTVPDMVRDAAVVLTLCRLYDRRKGPTENLARRRDRIVAWLKDVAAGRATLGENDPGGTPPSGSASIASSTRIFSRENLEDF